MQFKGEEPEVVAGIVVLSECTARTLLHDVDAHARKRGGGDKAAQPSAKVYSLRD